MEYPELFIVRTGHRVPVEKVLLSLHSLQELNGEVMIHFKQTCSMQKTLIGCCSIDNLKTSCKQWICEFHELNED